MKKKQIITKTNTINKYGFLKIKHPIITCKKVWFIDTYLVMKESYYCKLVEQQFSIVIVLKTLDYQLKYENIHYYIYILKKNN